MNCKRCRVENWLLDACEELAASCTNSILSTAALTIVERAKRCNDAGVDVDVDGHDNSGTHSIINGTVMTCSSEGNAMTESLHRILASRIYGWIVCDSIEPPMPSVRTRKNDEHLRNDDHMPVINASWDVPWTNVDRKLPLRRLCNSLRDALMCDFATTNVTLMFTKLLEIIDVAGLCYLLGMSCTVGSLSMMPLSREVCLTSFNKLHRPNSHSLLTVGARAFCKHAHRDKTNFFWGNCCSTESAKVNLATQMITYIMDNATFINSHYLPRMFPIFEIRIESGYGARWTIDGSTFRGFVEPVMEDGHKRGWCH